jgi:RND family efflux transporter MFP subunit
VEVATAALAQVAEQYEAGGVVQAMTSAAVASRVLAPVLAVHVAPGDRVRAGQALVTLDDRDLSAAVAQTGAAVTAATHAARGAVAGREGAQAAVALAEASLTRVRQLHERRSATPQELDDATAAARAARARLDAADAHVAQTDAALDAARAASSGSTVVAGFARITAPFAGRVTETLVETGNMASPGAPLVRMESLDGYRVDVRVDESRAAGLAPGQVLSVVLGDPSAPNRVEGTVLEVARAVDAADRASLLKVALPRGTAAVRAGGFARVLIPGPARQALAVPSTAIVRQGQIATVFVVEQGLARVRLVQPGRTGGAVTEIRSGLDAGERIVTSPPPALRDRTPVSVSPDAPAGSMGSGERSGHE